MDWHQMEEFAREYLKHDVFVHRIPRVTEEKLPRNIHLMHLPAPTSPYEEELRRQAQQTLCKAVKLRDSSTALMRGIIAFQRSLYLEVCRHVRSCLLRGQPPTSALNAAPPWARRAANVLQLLPAALKKQKQLLEREGAATVIVNTICAEWEALLGRGGASEGAPCSPECGGARGGGCAECRSSGLPPRAALRAAARHFEIEDTDALLRLWVSYRNVALSKLRALVAAGDDASRVPAAARPASADWRVLDLALLHDSSLRLLTEESVTHHEKLQPLITLFSLVQQHGLQPEHAEHPAGSAGSAWRAAHRQLTARGSSVSLVTMQRRWHELCARARARVLALHRAAAAAAAAAAPALPPLYQAIVRRFPELVTAPQRGWAALVAAGLVYTDILDSPELPPQWPADEPPGPPSPPPPPPPPLPENEDDIILIEKDVETIELEESDGETNEGNVENEVTNGAAEEMKCGTTLETLAKDTQNFQQVISKEIENYRESLRNNVVNLLETNTVNQNDKTMLEDSDVPVVQETSVLKASYSNVAHAGECIVNENLENICVTDAPLEKNYNTMTVQMSINTGNTSSQNNLDTGQQLDILQKINPESSETTIIFDEDDSDESDKPSGDGNGITENVVQSNKDSMQHTEEILAGGSAAEKYSESPNKNLSAEILNENKELSTERAQQVTEVPQLVTGSPHSDTKIPQFLTESVQVVTKKPELVQRTPEQVTERPVLVSEIPETIVPVNLADGVNINKELLTESSKLTPEISAVAIESSDAIISVIPADILTINKELPLVQSENRSINNDIDAECPALVTKSSELPTESLELVTEITKLTTSSQDSEEPVILADSLILNENRQATSEKPILKDDIQTETLNKNKVNCDESDTGVSGNENFTSTVENTLHSFSVIDKNILEYKTKLKSEIVDNVEIGDSDVYSTNVINRAVIDLFKENLSKHLEISEIIPNINIPTVTSIGTKLESERSSDCNSNDTEMVAPSSVDLDSASSGNKNIASEREDGADSEANMDTTDFAPASIDPKLLMTPSVPLTRLDAPSSRLLKPLLVEDFSAHPDFNVRLKALSARCLARNRHLLRLCRPLSVHVERMPGSVLDRYLGGERRARRVQLPDIEQVRRANRRLQCAQVAPTPLQAPHQARQEPDDTAADAPLATGVVQEDNEATLTQEQLMELLQRCSPPARARAGAGAGARAGAGAGGHCCVARRHRAYNDARRRLAANAHRAPPAEVDIHGAHHNKVGSRSSEECNCCCLHLVRGAADTELAQRLERQLRRLETRAASLLRTGAAQPPEEESDDDFDDDTANTSKPAEKKKRYDRKKPKKTNNEEKEASSSVAPSNDGYQEWIRQKNLTTKYFHINAIGDEFKQKPDKPNTDGHKRTDVATTVTDIYKNHNVTVQNKYVATIFSKGNKEENDKLNQEANAESTKVVSYTSASGQQIVKICKPLEEPKKYENRKRKSLGDIVENVPNKITIRIPSQLSVQLLDKSKNHTKISNDGLHNLIEMPVKKNGNVIPTTSKSSEVESSTQQNKLVSDNSSFLEPQLFVELNPFNSGSSVVGSVNSNIVTPLTTLNESTKETLIGSGSKGTSQGDTISQGKNLRPTAFLDSIERPEQLAELSDDSDDDSTDKLFIDETVGKLDCSESQNSNENKATSTSGIYQDVGQSASESKSNSDKKKQTETQDASSVTESNTDVVKVNKAEIEASIRSKIVFEIQNTDDETANETVQAEILVDSPSFTEKVNADKNYQNSEQNDKSDEELKTLPVKKVYQKLVRPKNKSESDKSILSIKINKKYSGKKNKPATDIAKYDKGSSKKLKTLETFPNSNATASKETHTGDDSDDDVQIVEPQASDTTVPTHLRSLLKGQSSDANFSAKRPPTLLEQIAKMHQTGKNFVIKKIDDNTPILYHSAANVNQVSRYVELVPETKIKGSQSQPTMLSQPAPGPVVNLNQQLASIGSPVTMKQPVTPQVLTIKHVSPSIASIDTQEPNVMTLDTTQTAQILQQNVQTLPLNAQILTRNESSSLNASGLVLNVSPEGLTLAEADDMATVSAVGGSFEVLPRITEVTSLAAPAPDAASTIVMKSIAAQSEGTATTTVTARADRPGRAEAWRLSALPPLDARHFVRHRDPTDITVLCVDAARPPLRLAEDHLVVTEMEIPCERPTYWTVASDKKTRMLSLDSPPPPPPPPLPPQLKLAPRVTPPPPGADRQEDTGTGTSDAAEKRGGLKVKSFAKFAQENALAPSAPPAPLDPPAPPAPAAPAAPLDSAPDCVRCDGKLYKKMTDDPIIYARVLHVAPDLAACRRALRAGAALGLRAPSGRVLRVLRAGAGAGAGEGETHCAPAPAPSTGLRCDGALPALTDLVRRLNQETNQTETDIISLDSDDE